MLTRELFRLSQSRDESARPSAAPTLRTMRTRARPPASATVAMELSGFDPPARATPQKQESRSETWSLLVLVSLRGRLHSRVWWKVLAADVSHVLGADEHVRANGLRARPRILAVVALLEASIAAPQRKDGDGGPEKERAEYKTRRGGAEQHRDDTKDEVDVGARLV